ncbi:hypothetical protein JHK85_018984 [Glycine max]|nr:hypothetical protein JHK85_018984 [Glycine max]
MAMDIESGWDRSDLTEKENEQTDALLGLDLRFESDTDCCQWERIKCDSSTGRVARLNLYHLLLDGLGKSGSLYLSVRG